MSQNLVPGQNCAVPDDTLSIAVRAGAAADFSAFRLFAGGRTRKDADFVFYGQNVNDDATVELSQEGDAAMFRVALPRLAPEVEKIVLAVTSDFPSLAALAFLELGILQGSVSLARCRLDVTARDEAALILGEFYRRNGQWKFRLVAQGFRGGLRPLAEAYGVDVADDAPAPPPAAPAVNLSKIVLTKSAPRVDLNKHTVGKGVFRVNLNWNRTAGSGGFFQRNAGVDLDLAAYVRLRSGEQTIIQALGNHFGDLDRPPYVKLLGDDRTGSREEGEWIHINGEHVDELAEVLIFTFIYSGIPNWQATDAAVRLEISGQPEIETRLSEGSNALPMCAVARLRNTGSELRIERLDRYFSGHRDMDKAFGWGFSWKAGSK